MTQRSPKTHGFHVCLLIVLAAGCLFQPPPALAAKTLASKALAAAIENGTLDQVSREMMMDVAQKQKFEFDEAGIEKLGRQLLDEGNTDLGVEILQLNHVVHQTSPRAANALGDAYRASGNDMSARIYYDMALRMDPENEDAKQGIEETGTAEELAMGAMGDLAAMEFDPEAMQDAMAQMGMEITPEQQQQMQEAMAELQKYQEDPGSYQAPERQRKKSPAPAEPAYESEYCEVLHRFNSHKKISDPQIRARVEGQYQEPDHSHWTWNVESTCGDFLIAVPLWADVSSPVLEVKGGNTFIDANGTTWAFEMGGDGRPKHVVKTDADGATTTMKRLGDPMKY